MTTDGKDITTEYGCLLLRGSYNDLFRYPKRKAVEYNNWAEEDGTEPDLSEVLFEPKPIKLNFLMKAGSVGEFLSKYDKLIADISAPGLRKFDFGFGKSHNLRYDANSDYAYPTAFNEGNNFAVFTLDFFEDNPPFGNAQFPEGGIYRHGSYAINGYDFGNFGIVSDKGFGDILTYPAAKPPFSDGRTVYSSTVRSQHKEIKLSLQMTAKSKAEFINNNAAFFNQLTKPGTQELYVRSFGTIPVYYTDCTDFKIEQWDDSKAACRFGIALTVPVVTRIDFGGTTQIGALYDTDGGYLADENNRLLILQ